MTDQLLDKLISDLERIHDDICDLKTDMSTMLDAYVNNLEKLL